MKLGLLSSCLLSAACCVGVLVIHGCAEQEQQAAPLIRSVQAEEFDMAPPIARKYREAITREWRYVWGLDAPIPMGAAQIEVESGWNEQAVSPAGAKGLAQFTAGTAKDYGATGNDVFNPDWAIRAAANYDRALYARVIYKPCDREGAALSQYNGGAKWHDLRRAKAANPDDFWNSVRVVNPGISVAAQRENEAYPGKIMERQKHYALWGRQVCFTP